MIISRLAYQIKSPTGRVIRVFVTQGWKTEVDLLIWTRKSAA
jgi:hypothetical protein